MPPTLNRLLPLVADRRGGRNWGMGGTGGVVPVTDSASFSLDSWWWRARSDWPATEGAADGGVKEPLVGVRALLASLEVSVASLEDFSVLKLALDRRLMDLIDSRLGAMAAGGYQGRALQGEDGAVRSRYEEGKWPAACLVVDSNVGGKHGAGEGGALRRALSWKAAKGNECRVGREGR